jgi:ubiquinone/menaquinone biosynthesis C-methylase UbiE
MDETRIREFWDSHPCGEGLLARDLASHGDYEAFFAEYDAYRYRTEPHILPNLDQIAFAGRDVLEIGLGQGADAEQIIRRGARWSGVDLTPESVERVRMRLALRGLPHASVRRGTATALPFPDASFDIVYSHGVLHHVPAIRDAQREIRRVLRPGGELVVMLYAKRSLNYLVAISVLRRLGLLALWVSGRDPGGIYHEHLEHARRLGIWRYLRMSEFIHHNTDGPANPFSKVYTMAEVRRSFPDFRVVRGHRHFLHAPPLPVSRLPGGSVLGWHLWVHLRPR